MTVDLGDRSVLIDEGQGEEENEGGQIGGPAGPGD